MLFGILDNTVIVLANLTTQAEKIFSYIFIHSDMINASVYEFLSLRLVHVRCVRSIM